MALKSHIAKRWLWALLLMALLFAGLEIRSRRQGMVPGQLYPAFHCTDSLVSNQLLLCDENGMNYHNAQYNWNDPLRHINAQGFLSTFDYTQQTMDSFHQLGKKVVFIIGDSYVEGVTTTTFDKTFVEQLRTLQRDYVVFNFGVGGTDPLQYKLVAERYSKLKPDLLLVVFCGANDIMNYPRQPTPNIPLYYQTNAGWLSSVVPAQKEGEPNRIFKTAQEAYEYYAYTATLFKRKELLPRLCKHLSITTQWYFKLYPGFPEGNYKAGYDCGASYQNLHSIDSICKTQNLPLAIVLTPDPDKDLLKNLKTRDGNSLKYAKIFRDLLPLTHFTSGFNFDTDFKAIDKRHFSDIGNEKFAAFTNSVILQQLQH
ncbi:MAG: hypothetical protein JWO06_31 [Bacteroidota bacterium]|nr:hypothetical protein [Bacteroidota bacterium]